MPQHHSSGVFFHYVAALYGVGARAGAYQSVAIIHQPAGGVAGPADRPASGAHPVPGPGRHRAPAPLPVRTALERTGGHLLSPAQAPAGTKRLSNLLRSPKWTHTLLEKFLWRRAGQYLTRLEQLGVRPWPSGKRACWRCRKASHWRGCVRSAPARRHASNTASRATTILPVESSRWNPPGGIPRWNPPGGIPPVESSRWNPPRWNPPVESGGIRWAAGDSTALQPEGTRSPGCAHIQGAASGGVLRQQDTALPQGILQV